VLVHEQYFGKIFDAVFIRLFFGRDAYDLPNFTSVFTARGASSRDI
jgi:hypothetical protein